METGDLVKRLRGGTHRDSALLRRCFEAANRIEALEAEVARLKAERDAAKIEAQSADMAHGALHNIQELLDSGNVPRGTFADDQVRNLVAMYNRMKAEVARLKEPMADEEMVAIATQAATDHLTDKAKKWDASVAVSRALAAIAPHIRAREAAAFRAGAEAMREAAVDAAIESGRRLDAIGRSVIASGHHAAARAIRALPLPDYQSTGDAT